MTMVTVTQSIPSGGIVVQWWSAPLVEQANVTRYNISLQPDCPADVAAQAQQVYDQLQAIDALATHTYDPYADPMYTPIPVVP